MEMSWNFVSPKKWEPWTSIDTGKISCKRKVNIVKKQECIPVGCVPSAAVAVSWGGVPGLGV